MARQAGNLRAFQNLLRQNIEDPKSNVRKFLSGTLRPHLLELLRRAKSEGGEVYAALYELNDPELIEALKQLGPKCNLILASGAYKAANKKKGTAAEPDENEKVRDDLKQNSNVKVFDRLVKSPHFAHNKFVVFCDQQGNPQTVWTGSTNWTVTGLCTQTNNGVLIDDADLAADYKSRWQELRVAGSGYPKSLAISGSKVESHAVDGASVHAWNVPCVKYVDLKDAKKYIAAAKEGVIYLMFNPGKGDGKKKEKALIQDILELDENKIFIEGMLNQDPGGKKDPIIQLTHKGQKLQPVSLPSILPKNLVGAGREWFKSTFMYNMVMIHSKVIVIDPMGAHPVVMTGSHNMGPKASSSNDDNLAIIAGASGLATEFAVYIMNVYGHYKWMFNEYLRTHGATATQAKVSKQYDGNADDDTWQQWYDSGPNRREIEFWLGKGA